jgi:hypothetical protein
LAVLEIEAVTSCMHTSDLPRSYIPNPMAYISVRGIPEPLG